MKKWRYCFLVLVFFVCLVLPVVADDEGIIVFTSTRDGNSEIYVVNSDGTGLTRLTDNPASDLSPAWSPDRTKIAFTSDRDGNNEIYVMNADGSGQTRITTNPASDKEPDWSPDGSMITFTSDRDSHLEIYRMNADGSDQTRLTFFISGGIYFNHDPTWSPDGSKIAFSSRRSFLNEAIYTMNPDGSQQTELPTGWAYMPTWSPSGTIVAFVYQEFRWDICVINADGTGGRTCLTNFGSNSNILNSYPTWSPDGSKIAFGSGQDIYVMNSDGSGQTLFITNGGDPDWGFKKNQIPAPEFPSIFLPVTMIIGFLGAVLFIQRTREH